MNNANFSVKKSLFRVWVASGSHARKLKKRQKTSKIVHNLHTQIKSSTFAEKIDDYETKNDNLRHFHGFCGSLFLQRDADDYNECRVPKGWGFNSGN